MPEVPKIKTIAPMLNTIDMESSLAFYKDVLGFTPVVASPSYCVIERGGQLIHLRQIVCILTGLIWCSNQFPVCLAEFMERRHDVIMDTLILVGFAITWILLVAVITRLRRIEARQTTSAPPQAEDSN